MNRDEEQDRLERKWVSVFKGDGMHIRLEPVEHVAVCGVKGWMQRIDDRAEVEALIASVGGGP